MITRSRIALWSAVIIVSNLFWTLPADAQLNMETEKLFEKLLPELDATLKTKFETAIREKQSWIEFTPEEFIRFRSHPANPFAGLDKIDPFAEPGLIRLEFKIPSIREREPELGERQHADQLQPFQSVSAQLAPSTVQVWADDQWVAMGTVVVSTGMIITKASEVEKKSKLVCRVSDHGLPRDLPATLLRVDERNDIALLKVAKKDLTPAKFVDREIIPGAFVVTPDQNGKPLVMGVTSTIKRSLIGVNQAYLGVRPMNGPAGVELAEITAGGSAELAGLRKGDIVTRIADSEIKSTTDLVNAIRLQQPGDKVRVHYSRDSQSHDVDVTLAGRNIGGERAARFNVMNQFGAIPSGRRDDFPMVFQHDSPLLPEYCGGPLIDVDGNVIGVNIARSGRVASYAIGAVEIQAIVDRLLREDVAAKQ